MPARRIGCAGEPSRSDIQMLCQVALGSLRDVHFDCKKYSLRSAKLVCFIYIMQVMLFQYL
jgi:hypothetical protein